LYKEFAPISERIVDSGFEISRYAETYMDEKDVADHKYRHKESAKSLEDYARDEAEIYDHYKHIAEQEGKQSEFERVRALLFSEKKKNEKLFKIHEEAKSNLA
jgi:hypothetical protein